MGVLFVICKSQMDLIVFLFPELNCLNPKSQNSNPKQISIYNESNSKRVWIIEAWNLDIVCYLVLGFFSIQGHNCTYISNTTYLTYLWDMTLSMAAATIALTFSNLAFVGISQPDCRIKPSGPNSRINLEL